MIRVYSPRFYLSNFLSMKKLFTLVAGYAVGLTVAMKYRKDHGTSKLTTDPSRSKIDGFIDEVVDIHKSAYDNAKEYVETNLEDVKDFDTLKSKVSSKITGLADEAETFLSSLKEKGTEKKEALDEKVDEIIEKKEVLIDEAKDAGSNFSDVAVDKIVGWIEWAKSKIETAHTAVKSKLDTPPIPKKTTSKKPTAKK